MCGCLRPDAIASRPSHPKLGASEPPTVLVMTRPWYAGATTTCALLEASERIITVVCCRRHATSASKRPADPGAAGSLLQPAVARLLIPTIIARATRLLTRTADDLSSY